MKHINITFDDWEFEKLINKKDGLSWHDFILLLLGLSEEELKLLSKKDE